MQCSANTGCEKNRIFYDVRNSHKNTVTNKKTPTKKNGDFFPTEFSETQIEAAGYYFLAIKLIKRL